MAENNNIHNYTAADIEKYWQGKLSLAEMHAMEKAAMDDPFLADAMEGYRLTESPSDESAAIHGMLAERTGASIPVSKPSLHWLKIAAAVVIVATIGYFGYDKLNEKKDGQVAIQQNQKAEITPVDSLSAPSAVTADTFPNFGQVAPITKTQLKADTSLNGSIAKTNDFATFNVDLDAAKASNESISIQKETKDMQVSPSAGRSDSLIQLQQARPEVYKMDEAADTKNKGLIANSVKRKKSDENFMSLRNSFVGQVTDAQNNPVPFANVTNLRDQVGTYTDMKGNFNLISGDSVMDLQVRSVGYETKNYRLAATPEPKKLTLEEDAFTKTNASSVPLARLKLSSRQQADSTDPEDEDEEEVEPTVGWTYYNTYVTNNIQLPETRGAKYSREVELTFQVDKSGTPTNIRISRSSKCKECDEAAIKVLRDGPKWKRASGKKRGSVVISVD